MVMLGLGHSYCKVCLWCGLPRRFCYIGHRSLQHEAENLKKGDSHFISVYIFFYCYIYLYH